MIEGKDLVPNVNTAVENVEKHDAVKSVKSIILTEGQYYTTQDVLQIVIKECDLSDNTCAYRTLEGPNTCTFVMEPEVFSHTHVLTMPR